ncbi:MAG: acetyl-CoA carboxylase carboxyltransferase subunit alpha [Flavobacteriales bacterium]|nr:acetyl-CoA carboxylase carboxyltransferase subunit alpha [Flavobacteriales bacterium]
MRTFLPFEEPIKELSDQIEELERINQKGDANVSKSINDLKKKMSKVTKEVYSDLSAWDRVQVSRHPERPYTLDYIEALTQGTFVELHGDRSVKDDKAMVGGFGQVDGKTLMFIGQQKGKNTKLRQYRNFGMANPEGYRKALRLMKLAEKFGKPIVTFIDTPGAYPGIEAEERGQGEAIARNLYEMIGLKVPLICIIIGEGASGGALGIGLGDKVLMLENTWYSVISPESCSSILWRTWDKKEIAAEALKLTPKDMLKNKLIDGVIKEPIGGAHAHPEEMYKNMRKEIKANIEKVAALEPEVRIDRRIQKFTAMGAFKAKSK